MERKKYTRLAPYFIDYRMVVSLEYKYTHFVSLGQSFDLIEFEDPSESE